MQALIAVMSRKGRPSLTTAAFLILTLLLAPAGGRASSPGNDSCGGAVTIPGAGPFPYPAPLVDITDATTGGELLVTNTCQPFVSRGVWYSFKPAQSGPYTLSTCSPSTTVGDTVLAVFTSVGGCSGPFAQVTCDDDACDPNGGPSQATAQLFADTTYYILVWQYEEEPPAPGKGFVELTVTREVVPSNDNCATAIPVALNIPVAGSTLGATNDYQLGGNACFNGIGQVASTAPGRDVVYRFMAPEDGDYSIKAANYSTASGFNLVVYVAEFNAVESVPRTITNCLAAVNRNGASSAEEIPRLPLTNGQQVYIYIDDGDANSGSTFTLEVTRYRPESEPNNSPTNASRLVFGMTGAINPAGDNDCFSLGNFPAGWRAFVMVDGETANIPDFQLRVISTNSTLEFDDDDNDALYGQSSPNISGTPVPGGPVFARVNYNGAATVGPYRIYGVVQPPADLAAVEVEPNDLTGTANADERNYFSGTLNGPAPSADADVYSFTVSDGDLIFLSLDEDPLRDNTPINAKLELLDEFGNVLIVANDNNSSSSTNVGVGLFAETPRSPGEAIVYRCPAEGILFARVSIGTVSAGASGAGDYLLSISRNGGIGSVGATHPVELTEVSINTRVAEGSPAIISGRLNDLDTGEILNLAVDWGDGTSSLFPLPGGLYQFNVAHEYGGGVPPVMAPANYFIEMTVTDSQGNQVMDFLDVTVTNGAPVVSLSLQSNPMAEGSTAVLNGSFKDLSPFDTHVVVINWGDGSPELTIVPDLGVRAFSASHLYEDDQPAGAYPITAIVSDSQSGVGTNSIALLVTNAPPRIRTFSLTGPIQPGNASTVSGEFFDPGIRDSHILTVDWGDGSGSLSYNLPFGATNFVVSHEFEFGPTNSMMQLTLTDKDNGSESRSGTVQVLDGSSRAAFTSFSYLSGSPQPRMRLVLLGVPGGIYRVEKSTDLKTWSELITLQADPAGYFEATDSAGGPESTFYRAVSDF